MMKDKPASTVKPAQEHRHAQLVLARQEPLRRRYRVAPEDALITDRAIAVDGAGEDPFHGILEAGSGQPQRWRIGIHRAVGGDHDHPNPGDLLCAALAGCFDTTLRMIAARMGIPLTHLRLQVDGDVDVRGTLAVDREVSVGMQRMRCHLHLGVGPAVDEAALQRLVRATERACVVLQTLRHGVQIDLDTRLVDFARRDSSVGDGPRANTAAGSLPEAAFATTPAPKGG